jgi:hypothetical protein
MPWKTTKDRARRDRRAGKAPTTQAGNFVREEMEHVKRGKHGVKSGKQAIAIGLSKARRSGVKLGPNPSKRRTRRSAKRSGSRSAPRRTAAKSTSARSTSRRRSPRRRSKRSR